MTENQESVWEKIAGKLHNELSAEEEIEFNEMISDPGCARNFEKAQKIRNDLTHAGSVLFQRKVASLKRIESGIKTYQRRWIQAVLKYAAIVIVAFMAGNLFRLLTQQEQQPHFSELYVPYGQMSQLTLSDGTTVWLNSGTTLRYPERFSEETRSVYISGEAYFKVSKMPDKPFIVSSPDLKVKVLGTSFNFSAYKDDSYSSVTLVEGSVAVQDSLGKTIAKLHSGQIATKDKGANSFMIKGEKTAFYSAWIEGEIFFDDERLDQIAIKLERWFNVEITFSDSQLKTKRFTGTILKNKPVDQIMQALELLSTIKFKHQINTNGKDQITIYKRI